jgi:hypothetical protein
MVARHDRFTLLRPEPVRFRSVAAMFDRNSGNSRASRLRNVVLGHAPARIALGVGWLLTAR